MNSANHEQALGDRDIFILVVIIGLAFSLNSEGLLRFVERYVATSPLRAVGYSSVFFAGGCIGLFSKRIALRITAWRDDREA